MKLLKLEMDDRGISVLLGKEVTDPDTGETHIVDKHRSTFNPADPGAPTQVNFVKEGGVEKYPPMLIADIISQATLLAQEAKVNAELERDTVKSENNNLKQQIQTITTQATSLAAERDSAVLELNRERAKGRP